MRYLDFCQDNTLIPTINVTNISLDKVDDITIDSDGDIVDYTPRLLSSVYENDTTLDGIESDVAGFRYQGDRAVIERKDYGGKIHAAQWVRKATKEAKNGNARAGLAVVKRRGVTAPEQRYVPMELGQLLALLGGPHDD